MVFIVIFILAFILQLFLPSWIVIVLCFATCGLIGKTPRIAFWQPFFAIATLWLGVALFRSIPNDHLLATRVAQLFGVKFWPAILAITGLIGGLLAGFCGLCGYHFRKAVLTKK